jgi:hypothetical protein
LCCSRFHRSVKDFVSIICNGEVFSVSSWVWQHADAPRS